MRTPTLLLVSSLLALQAAVAGCSPGADDPAAETGDATPEASGEAPAFQDPDLQRVWSTMMDTLAPDDGFDRTRYIHFDWIVSRPEGEPLVRSHSWALWEGDYEVVAPVDGQQMVAQFNVNDPTGTDRVWLDGERVTDEARSDSLAERANAMFINDSYWLLMPFKWDDPGVTAEYLGRQEMWGEEYEVVELTFDAVGLTPQNKYRAFVDPESGLMEIWQHYRNAEDAEPGFTLGWTDWQRYGPIMLSSQRPDESGDSRIYFENLEASTTVPEDAFEPPAGAETEAAGESGGG